MSNLLDEDLLPFAQGIRSLPGRPHISFGYRAIKGIRGVKLETILVGGRRWTSKQALRRFVARVTTEANGETSSNTAPSEQGFSNKHIERELDDAGI